MDVQELQAPPSGPLMLGSWAQFIGRWRAAVQNELQHFDLRHQKVNDFDSIQKARTKVRHEVFFTVYAFQSRPSAGTIKTLLRQEVTFGVHLLG